ncbi:MAG: methylated-DNA--[protein]-cysteine S-methyltransferase [Sphingomonadales bacterium]
MVALQELSGSERVKTAEDPFYKALVERDSRYDGVVYYAVTSTGIVCRASCPARKPKPENVALYLSLEAALDDGFRPCKRCKPEGEAPADAVLAKVVEACRAIEEDEDAKPDWAELAGSLGMSERRLRDIFKSALGVSPGQFASALRHSRFRRALRAGESVTNAVYEAGFGSPSRVYEASAKRLGMTPGAFQKGGAGEEISYKVSKTPFGPMLVAGTKRGICSILFVDNSQTLIEMLEADFPAATIRPDDGPISEWSKALTDYLKGAANWPLLPVDVRATAFQAKVWQALRDIPEGDTATYAEIASKIGSPGAARAVGTACAKNQVALAIPCHRVLPKAGDVGGYRWSPERKRFLIELERHG